MTLFARHADLRGENRVAPSHAQPAIGVAHGHGRDAARTEGHVGRPEEPAPRELPESERADDGVAPSPGEVLGEEVGGRAEISPAVRAGEDEAVLFVAIVDGCRDARVGRCDGRRRWRIGTGERRGEPADRGAGEVLGVRLLGFTIIPTLRRRPSRLRRGLPEPASRELRRPSRDGLAVHPVRDVVHATRERERDVADSPARHPPHGLADVLGG